jgi:hypothetical protein
MLRGAVMREFGTPRFRLAQLSRDGKWVYTGFLIFAALGFCTNGLLQLTRIGLTLDRIALYYRGGELEQAMTFPKTFAQLLELTHFHTFIMGVIFLILAHLVTATDTSPRLKTGLIILAGAGSLGDIASYWLIRYVSPVFALLQLLSWIGMWIGYGGMIVLTLWDMWCTT